MPRHTSTGVLAVWKEGAVTETSVIHPSRQRELHRLGSAGIRSAAAATFTALDFAPPQWHYPTETYLGASAAAWKLGEVCVGRTDVHVLIFRNATLDEVCSLQVGIQTGYEEFVAASRDLLSDTRRSAAVEPGGLLDQHREIAMGSLIVPLLNSDDLTDAMLARIVAEPAPAMYEQQKTAA
jgi:hypothetical protein